MKYCPDCGRPLDGFTRHPHCDPHCKPSTSDGSGDMLTSAVIGYATNSALLGTVIGGNPVGAIMGDLFNDSSSSGIADTVSSLFD